MLVSKLKCPKCSWKWIPRVKTPKKCPKCGYYIEDVEALLVTP
jgi:hypothetical protein